MNNIAKDKDKTDVKEPREVPNMDIIRKHLLREGHINKPELMEIIKGAANILSKYFSNILF